MNIEDQLNALFFGGDQERRYLNGVINKLLSVAEKTHPRFNLLYCHEEHGERVFIKCERELRTQISNETQESKIEMKQANLSFFQNFKACHRCWQTLLNTNSNRS